MKKIFTLAVFLILCIGFAQETQKNTNFNATTATIPAGYYNTATGTGYVLKTQLYNIIKGHNDQGYAGLWTTYSTSDRDLFYENDNTVLDVYSENPTGTDPYTFIYSTNQCGSYSVEGDCYNREHTVPQSFFGNSVQPMYSDAHFVLPTDGKVNGKRDDFPYGKVGTASWTSLNGSKFGNNSNTGYAAGYSLTVFEPIDEFKGDIARCLLYFATRYETQIAGFYTSTASTAKIMFDGSSDQVFSNTFLNILLTWHMQDPVNAREISRNNAVYARQNNRNPYIDHPEYVCQIWSTQCAALSNPTLEFASISVYPNPSNEHKINIDSQIAVDDIQLININGQLMMEVKKPVFNNNSYTLENLPQGFYFLKLSTENQSLTKKVIIN
jgi:endonuclease I